MIQTNLSLSSSDDNESCITNRSSLTDEEKRTILLAMGIGGVVTIPVLPDSTRYGVDIQVVQVFVSSTSNVSGLGCLVLWMRVCTYLR